MQHLLLSNTISCELNSEIKQNVNLMWTHTHDLIGHMKFGTRIILFLFLFSKEDKIQNNFDSSIVSLDDEFLNDESQLKNETETDDLFQSFTETSNLDFDKLELKDVIPILFYHHITMNLPSAVRTKSFFVFDLNLTKYDDIIRDENGSYWNNGAKKKFYEIDRLTEPKLKFLSNNK
ncbi:hypothetical protein BpHYR1_045003 [Brachionus plicatilis]|uniref:Uncharacterized protein n=1 Tax=Brachionus plicatilis TaxID=10195 RepID=A0A3M7QDQ3_BRAPC|nr:hypothetical protein BpHYR1_045003 [Brachionus plicatilis]